MQWKIPYSSATLSEARLYAIESSEHTLDYHGWEDGHFKLQRLTYGKFAQLWVYEFCRLNGINCQKDRSGPQKPDDKDLVIRGHDVDVKTSINPKLIGQISPGMYHKNDGFYCFTLTDKACSFILPIGFMHCADFIHFSHEVKKGEVIPGTDVVQRFGNSRFLNQNSGLIDFYTFMAEAKNGNLNNYAIPL